MVKQTGCKLVAHGAQPQRAVGIGHHGFASSVAQAQMKMQAAAGSVGKRFSHAAKHHAVLFSDGMRCHLKKQVPVSCRQGIVKPVVNFVLSVSVFVVCLFQLKAERCQRSPHFFKVGLVAVNCLQVV